MYTQADGLTRNEITEVLVGEGYKEGSEEFHVERRSRFVPMEGMTNEQGEYLYFDIATVES